MNTHIPRTPFSTALSGSARETELRLKHIFSGPKKRPPILLLALMFSVCLLCGNLVSCQNAESESPDDPDSSAIVPVPPGASSEDSYKGWTAAALDIGLLQHNESVLDAPLANFSEKDIAFLTQNLPAKDMPREAVDPYESLRGDYWQDMLLPVAADETEDVTVYFVVERERELLTANNAQVPSMLQDRAPDGIVLRCGDLASYFPLAWDKYHQSSFGPLLTVDDLDHDGRPEAAVALCVSSGTGVYVDNLYIFDLDTMTYSVPDYSEIPLEIIASPDGTAARVISGDWEFLTDLTQLDKPFEGKAEVGNQVRFPPGAVKQESDPLRLLRTEDGWPVCELELNFGCDTLSYLVFVRFPVVYRDGVYRLGPALQMGDAH